MKIQNNTSLSLLISLLLAGCASAPQTQINATKIQALPVASTSKANGEWPAAEWWQRYQDPVLNQLVQRAIESGPTVAIAESRALQAQQLAMVVASQQDAQIVSYADASRQRLSENGLFPSKFLGFNWYNQFDLGVRASYNFDWWHKQRDTLAATLNEAAVAQAERNIAALQLSTAITSAYFGWQADQVQLSQTKQQLDSLSQRKKITEARIAAQLEPNDGMYALEMERAAITASLANIKTSADLRRVLIASLIGISPDELPAFRAQVLPEVASQIPNDVRIDLLARRADIDASRLQIEAAEHRLNVAHAEFMPDISINALAGLSSIDVEKLLQAGSATPSLGLALHLPIFDTKRLRAQFGIRAAQVEQAIQIYNSTLANAAREVGTQTLMMQQLVQLKTEQQAQINSAEKLVALAQQRKEHGIADARPYLQALQSLYQQQAAMTALQARAIDTDIALIAALGGGYQHEEQVH